MKNMDKWFLSLPRDVKIEHLKCFLECNGVLMTMPVVKLLLDSPINEGGIETEVINELVNKQISK